MFIKNGDPQPITSVIVESDLNDEDTKKQLKKVLDETEQKNSTNSEKNGK